MSEKISDKMDDNFIFSQEDTIKELKVNKAWKILIADDDEGVHNVTELVFSSFQFQERPIEFLNTYSGKETIELLRSEKEIAVILLDVVMETDDAGLEVIKTIRNDLNNKLVRIILRTGQPGQAPEEQVLIDYDINDYKNKSELTSRKLKSSIITSLRSFEDIKQINDLNENLERKVKERTADLAASLAVIEQDEQAGKKIQFKLLPENNLSIRDICFNRELFPSLYLSGDFVDYFRINDKYLAFYIADVSGHGASSAFITVYLKSMISGFIGSYNDNGVMLILEPDQLLNVINQSLIKEDLGKYLTIFYGVINLEDNTMSYSTGGQYPFPIFMDSKGKRYIEMKGPPVGLLKIARYKKETFQLEDDFSMMFMSDGILEILKNKSLLDQEKDLLEMINIDTEVSDIIEVLQIDEKSSLPDDITILNLRRKKGE